MNALLRISEAATLLGVSTKTIRRWDKRKRIECFRTVGGHRRITLSEVKRILYGLPMKIKEKKTAIYARVSSHDQKKKGDLERQISKTKGFIKANGLKKDRIFTDVGSGLNTKRRGFLRLCKAIENQEINQVIITYPDRLTRFGFPYLERYFSSHGALIEVLNKKGSQTLEEEMVQDLISIITSFSGRVHGMRSARARKKKL